MSESKTIKPHFRVELTEDNKIHVEVDGNGQELMNLFANVINDNEDLAEVITLALMAVQMRRDQESGVETLSEEEVAEMIKSMKVVAEA